MTAIQTLCLFATGYLTTRLLLAAELHRDLVRRLLSRARGRVSHVVLGVMLLAFLMSTVVPNALTVLALLPVIAHLRRLASQGLIKPGQRDPPIELAEGHTGELAQDRAGELAEEHAGESAKDRAGDLARERTGESTRERTGESTREHTGESAREHTGESAREHTDESAKDHAGEPPYYGTLLVMGLIYGANIGGVGSLLGSPANLYLLLSLRLYEVPGRESLHFVSWLVFGLPLALSLVLLAWAVLRLAAPTGMAARLPELTPTSPGEEPPEASSCPDGRRRPALRFGQVWLMGWAAIIAAGLILGRGHGPGRAATSELGSGTLLGHGWAITWLDAVALFLSALFVLGIFLWRVPTGEGSRPLFKPRDLTREVPWRGILVAAVVLGLLALVAQSGVVGYLRSQIPSMLPQAGSPFVFSLVLVTVTIFATEVLNNTTVSTVMFPVAAAAAPAMGADPLTTMLGISLASTCAFMTPVATPVNALALASLRGISLRRFLFCGLWVNLVAVMCIAIFVTWAVPPVLRLFGAP